MKYTVLLAALAAVVGLSACQKKPADQPPAPEVVQPTPTPAPATPPATVQPDGSTKPADTTPPPSSTPPEQR